MTLPPATYTLLLISVFITALSGVWNENQLKTLELTFFDQIALMQKTTVLITFPGGISMTAAFLSRHTPAIFFDFWDTRKNASSNMEQWFWRTTSSVADLYYDVDFSEVHMPPEEGSPSDNSYENYRNFGCISASADKLVPLVATALDIAAESNPMLQRAGGLRLPKV